MRLVKDGYGGWIPSPTELAEAAAAFLRYRDPSVVGPLTVRDLAPEAWARYGWPAENATSSERSRSVEKLRESAALRSHGLLYLGESRVGAAHADVGLVYLAEWMISDQLALINNSCTLLVPIDYESSREASAETAMRVRHMINKHGSSDVVCARRAGGGLVLQIPVSNWFKNVYGERIWMPPTNKADYKRGAPDDFRLRLKDDGGAQRSVLVDVTGPAVGSRGEFWMKEDPRAGVYILAIGAGQYVEAIGWATQAEIMRGVRYGSERPIDQLLVRCDCERRGIGYAAMNAEFRQPSRRASRPNGKRRHKSDGTGDIFGPAAL